jgi:hypothetical protein
MLASFDQQDCIHLVVIKMMSLAWLICWSYIPVGFATIDGPYLVLRIFGRLGNSGCSFISVRRGMVRLDLIHLDILQLPLYSLDLMHHFCLLVIVVKMLKHGFDTYHCQQRDGIARILLMEGLQERPNETSTDAVSVHFKNANELKIKIFDRKMDKKLDERTIDALCKWRYKSNLPVAGMLAILCNLTLQLIGAFCLAIAIFVTV